jgi:tetratricopeptide (TPR) repeat protein
MNSIRESRMPTPISTPEAETPCCEMDKVQALVGLGRFEEALPPALRCWEMAQLGSGDAEEVEAVSMVGFLVTEIQGPEAALFFLRREYVLRKRLGDLDKLALIHARIAWLLGLAGRPRASLHHARRAARLSHDSQHPMSDPRDVFLWLAELGEWFLEQGRCQASLDCFRLALPLAPACWPAWGKPRVLGGIASAHEALGDLPAAVTYQDKACRVLYELRQTIAMAHGLIRLACLRERQGHTWASVELYRMALDVFRNTGEHWAAERVQGLIRRSQMIPRRLSLSGPTKTFRFQAH